MTNYKAWAAATIITLIGGGLYFHQTTKPPAESVEEKKVEKPAPQESHGVGIIDLEKILEKIL